MATQKSMQARSSVNIIFHVIWQLQTFKSTLWVHLRTYLYIKELQCHCSANGQIHAASLNCSYTDTSYAKYT